MNFWIDSARDRFLEVLNDKSSEPIRPDRISEVARAICDRLNAEEAHFEASLTYFIKKLAPVTKQPGLMDYRVTFECSANHHTDFIMGVSAPATSLCPCSKEISAYGAHNQRSHITITVEARTPIGIDELIRVAEDNASSELYGVLKRPDEKFVTERAYDNPKFVEDLVRDVAGDLDRDPRVLVYSVEGENFESIHNHSAYAMVTRSKADRPAGPAAG